MNIIPCTYKTINFTRWLLHFKLPFNYAKTSESSVSKRGSKRWCKMVHTLPFDAFEVSIKWITYLQLTTSFNYSVDISYVCWDKCLRDRDWNGAESEKHFNLLLWLIRIFSFGPLFTIQYYNILTFRRRTSPFSMIVVFDKNNKH